MQQNPLYRFFSSRLAVAISLVVFLSLTAAVVFRIIPLWLYLTVLGLTILGTTAYILLRDRLALRRDKSFEQAMDEHAERSATRLKARDRASLRDMHERWKEGFERLKKSRVGRGRRALYFLPWYVIVGKVATGKTTALKNSGLHFPLDIPETAGTGGTRNCDWFFAEEAILLDTAGRYTESSENASDHEEWISFLRLMRKYRRDMPINGLIVAVAADDLLGKDASEISADARQMRGRLDEIMSELGILFPVYLLVTKCDLVRGFSEFFKRSPKNRLGELLGWTNPSWEMEGVDRLLRETFATLQGRMGDLRLSFMREEDNPVALRDLYLFPEEFKSLTEALTGYCDILFRPSRYQDTPFLRGVYLTSSLQTGTAFSPILDRLGITASEVERVESRSYFLQDFFQERLREDRQLVVPTGSATLRLRVVNNVGLGAVALVCLLFATFASASYVRNRTLLNRVQDAVKNAEVFPSLPPEMQADRLSGYWKDLKELRERANHPDWLERFGLFKGEKALPVVETSFINGYEIAAHRPALQAADAALEQRTNIPRAMDALVALVAYLNETRDARYGDLESGGEALASWWNPELAGDEGMRQNFASSYRFYIRDAWRSSADPKVQARADEERKEQAAKVREAVPTLLSVSGVRTWLDGTANHPELGGDMPAEIASVHPAFTKEAWSGKVQPLVERIRTIEPELVGYSSSKFVREYADAYYDEWFRPVMSLREPTGSRIDERYCLESSPHFQVMKKVQEGVSVSFPDIPKPAWVGSVDNLLAKRAEYFAAITPVCQLNNQFGDPCASLARVKAPGGQSLDTVEDQVRQIVGAHLAEDPRDLELRAHLEKILSAPVKIAGGQVRQACSDYLLDRFNQAGLKLPPTPRIDDIERVLAPNFGAAWQFCDKVLSPYFDCRAARPLPGTPVQVPGQIAQYYRNAGESSRFFFDTRGGWKQHLISFESLPGTEIGSGARVIQTELTVSCQHLDEHPWTLSHRNTFVRKSLRWQPDQCDEVRLEVMLGMPDGSQVPSPPARSLTGPFALLQLLSEATRNGDEFTWSFPNGAAATFRVTMADSSLLSYYKTLRPR